MKHKTLSENRDVPSPNLVGAMPLAGDPLPSRKDVDCWWSAVWQWRGSPVQQALA